MVGMRISARADYAVRALPELAVRRDDCPVKAEGVAAAQDIPHKFLEGILGGLRRGGGAARQCAQDPGSQGVGISRCEWPERHLSEPGGGPYDATVP